MKTSLRLIVACALLSVLAAAQASQNNFPTATGASGITSGSGVPASCTGQTIYQDLTTGIFYTCQGGIYTPSSSTTAPPKIDVESLAGATNDLKWQACWLLLGAQGGICDDTRFTNTNVNTQIWPTDPFWNHTTNTALMGKGTVAILGCAIYTTNVPIIQGSTNTLFVSSCGQRGSTASTSGAIIRSSNIGNFGANIFSTGTVNTTAGSATVTANGGQDWSTVFGADPTTWSILINTTGTPCGGAGQQCQVFGRVTAFTAGVNGTLTIDPPAQSTTASATYKLTPPVFSQGFHGTDVFGAQIKGVNIDCNSMQTYQGGVGFTRVAAQEESYIDSMNISNCGLEAYYVAGSKAQNSGPDRNIEFIDPTTGLVNSWTSCAHIGGKTQSAAGGEMTGWKGIQGGTCNLQQNATPASKADGTVATTYGSANITGTGTLFQTNQEIGWFFVAGPNASNQYCFGQIISTSSDTAAVLDRPCQATLAAQAYTVRGCSAATTACAAAGGGMFPATGFKIDSRGGLYDGLHIERLGVPYWVGSQFVQTGGLSITNSGSCNSAGICGGTINGAVSLVDIGLGVTDLNIRDLTPLGTTMLVTDENEGPFGQASTSTFVRAATTTILSQYTIDKIGSVWSRISSSQDATSLWPSLGFNQQGAHFITSVAANDFGGTLTCAASVATKTFTTAFTSTPTILVFDETTKGGVNLTAKSNTAFSISCTGATDVTDYIVIGNPN